MGRRNGGQGQPKKRNKAHSQTPRSSVGLFLSEDRIAKFRDVIHSVCIAVEMSLPLGVCDLQNVEKIRDLLNLATLLKQSEIGHYIDPKFAIESAEGWAEFQDAFGSFYTRAMTQGKFTCTAREINVLRDGFEWVRDLLMIELEDEPEFVFKAFAAMKQRLASARGSLRVAVDMDRFRRQIGHLASQRGALQLPPNIS